ncbi:MAG TPA: ABC transporter permease [Longimicrobium sp.]|jgi:predicted permease
MGRLRGLAARLRSLLRREERDAEMDEELRFHLEMETQKNLSAGMAPDEAARRARLDFGGVEGTREALRDGRRVGWLEDAWADARYAVRALRRSPGFAVVAVATLALGIGATSAMFAAVDIALLRPLPYPRADRLVRIYQGSGPQSLWGISMAEYLAVVEQQRSFVSVAALTVPGEAALTGGGEPEWVQASRVTAGLLRTLGVSVAEGRDFGAGEDRPGAPPVAVVTHAFAEHRFGRGAGAVGREIVLDGTSHTVVGVLPPGVRDLAGFRADVWPVLTVEPPPRRGPFLLRGFARLRDGVAPEAAARDLAGISERIFPLWASSYQDRSSRLTPVPLRETIVGRARRPLAVFSGAVVLVLLIGVANVANLVLVRASGRRREIALRSALGAGRGRLARLLAVESLVLAALGGAAGLLVAYGGVRALARLMPGLPRIAEARLDLRTVAFAALAALGSAVLVGAYPLVFTLSRDLASSFRGAGRHASAERKTRWFQGGLVVAEFALALPLLMGAGLLLHSFVRLQRVDPGFDPERLLAVRVSLPDTRYPDSLAVQRFWDEALRRVRGVPGVAEAGLTLSLPPDDPGDENNFELLDRPRDDGSQPVAPYSPATPELFRALGVPLLEGRLFDARDDGDAPPVVVVSRAWARRYYPGERAVGRRLRSGGCSECPPRTVVGVVGDVKYYGLQGGGEAMYLPFLQDTRTAMNLVVRTARDPGEVAAGVRARIRSLDPDLPLEGMATMEERLYDSMTGPRRWTRLLGAFAAAAVLLAAIGIFGVMSYTVAQQRQEIGVRMALGATPAAVVGLVVGRGMRRALLGVALGVAVAVPAARVLKGVLFEVGAADPPTVAAVTALLFSVALLACWLPARRAARVNPVEAITVE